MNDRSTTRLISLTALLITAVTPVARAADSAVVLMYHRFGEDRFPSTSIRLEQFDAHLEHLKAGDFTVAPLADLLAAVTTGAPLPDRAVVITIDDAYRSVFDIAHAKFRRYDFPYTVFVNTDGVDEGLAAYMSWEQMRELQRDGATFANHGAAHDSTVAAIKGESDTDRLARVRADVAKGWRRLTEELEPLAGAFAYPYGEYDTGAADLLREMGYVSFGQHSGAVGPHNDTRALPRFPMAESFGDIGEFRTKVASRPLPVVNVEPWNPVVSATRPPVAITLGEDVSRISELACFVSGQGRVDVEWLEDRRKFQIVPARPLGKGRQRVNCTAPGNDGRYFWFSQPWIVR